MGILEVGKPAMQDGKSRYVGNRGVYDRCAYEFYMNFRFRKTGHLMRQSLLRRVLVDLMMRTNTSDFRIGAHYVV